MTAEDGTTLDAFAGPGGWDEGARILGLDLNIVGIELDPEAARAAITAGHTRIVRDILDIDPADYPHARGAILSSPCPTFSSSGKGSGRRDMQILLDVITHAGSGCDCTWEEIAVELQDCDDPRTALAAQCIRFALLLPNIEWIALEQVPAAEAMFEDIAAELVSFDDGGADSVFPDGTWNPDGTGGGGCGPGWESVDVFTIDAQHFGMPVRRERSFLVGRRYDALGRPGVAYPGCPPRWPAPTMAEALGWPRGHQIRTRGNRKATGGNLFPCDGLSWCLTGKARSWEREADGLRLTAAEAGRLNGFRRDYPWSGSRTRQFHQAGDVVVPPVAAAVLGYATGTPWTEALLDHLETLYGPAGQLGLFEELAA